MNFAGHNPTITRIHRRVRPAARCLLLCDMWRAGHAHAGVYLVLSLVTLRYGDEAMLSPFWKWLARVGVPIAAILIPAAFFLSVLSPDAKQPNGLINLAYIGAIFLAGGVLSLGVGLIRATRTM